MWLLQFGNRSVTVCLHLHREETRIEVVKSPWLLNTLEHETRLNKFKNPILTSAPPHDNDLVYSV
jgi:hypothetical protein